ncbi:Patched domain-containing protein 3 [Toxocara canis]|nr:Patched domain-containing protein 3 [Toxocara canis]
MVPVSLLFIPQPLCALVIALNIASIALGVIGFMTWWDVNLDATSMITIAMSVGFSVDFAAHITYGYMTGSKTKYEKIRAPYARLVGALGTVG